MALVLADLYQAGADENRLEFVQRGAEVVIDDQIVVFNIMAHLGGGLLHAALDHVFAVLTPVVQTLAQGFTTGRQDEYGTGSGHQAAHLPGALPVDFQNQVLALIQRLLHPLLGGAVKIAEYFGMFQKLATSDHGSKVVLAGEVVVDTVGFTRAHGAGGVGNGDANEVQFVQQCLDQAGFARARRGGQDVKGSRSAHAWGACNDGGASARCGERIQGASVAKNRRRGMEVMMWVSEWPAAPKGQLSAGRVRVILTAGGM